MKSHVLAMVGCPDPCHDTQWTRMTLSGKRVPTYLAMEFSAPWERGPKNCKGPKRGWKGQKKMLHDPDGEFKVVKTKHGWLKIPAPESLKEYTK